MWNTPHCAIVESQFVVLIWALNTEFAQYKKKFVNLISRWQIVYRLICDQMSIFDL